LNFIIETRHSHFLVLSVFLVFYFLLQIQR